MAKEVTYELLREMYDDIINNKDKYDEFFEDYLQVSQEYFSMNEVLFETRNKISMDYFNKQEVIDSVLNGTFNQEETIKQIHKTVINDPEYKKLLNKEETLHTKMNMMFEEVANHSQVKRLLPNDDEILPS